MFVISRLSFYRHFLTSYWGIPPFFFLVIMEVFDFWLLRVICWQYLNVTLGHTLFVIKVSISAVASRVTPRFSARPDWRIRTEFEVREHILGLCLIRHWYIQVLEYINISYTKVQNKTTTVRDTVPSPIYIFKKKLYIYNY